MNIHPIIHNGYLYRYEGHLAPRNETEMNRYYYYCTLCWLKRCNAMLFRIVPWPDHTDEPEYVEVIGEHSHPPRADWMFSFPYGSIQEQRWYLH